MKSFFLEFFQFLADSILIICFSLASFLLILNFYHSSEVAYQYPAYLSNNTSYNKVKDDLVSVDKKMNSVDYKNVNYHVTAKPIYEYYTACKNELEQGVFYGLDNNDNVKYLDIYKSNDEIVNSYNNTCLYSMIYTISAMDNKYNFDNDFSSVFDVTEEKRLLLIGYSEHLTKAGLENSSYSFSTQTFKGTIYNKTASQLSLTIYNYSILVSILDDIADWYVLEFGGNA